MRGAAVLREVSSGKLAESDIDNRVRCARPFRSTKAWSISHSEVFLHQVLGLINKAIASEIPFNAPESSIDTPAMRSLLRTAASSAIVLLKNSSSLLPLPPSTKSIAVIGSNAKIAVPSGGGSASLVSTYSISPLDGIRDAAKKIGATVQYSSGASAFRYLPLLDSLMTPGKIEVFVKSPVKNWYRKVNEILPKADWDTTSKSTLAFMIDGVPWATLGESPLTRVSPRALFSSCSSPN